MQFAARPPSSNWEPIPITGEPHSFLWAWFKPPLAPQGLMVRIPDETFHDYGRRQPLTIRSVLASLGIDARLVMAWSIYGATYDAQNGANPALDYPIPEPGAGVDSTISIFVGSIPSVVPAAAGFAPIAQEGAGTSNFSRMESDWNASLQIEVQLAGAAKQLNATLMRINSLNRDLSSEERRWADQQDQREWHEARRWLRDAAARLARFLKDHHIGVTSTIGKRGSFEAVYQQYVVPRRRFEGMEHTERELEAYRKTMQTLLNNMSAAHGAAVQDAERRAQLVLARISAKVRATRAKR
ncbi:MAG TPA: hypothetical protein VKU82_02650 [Planctomycetaceae bacterium]|nr:hypothetical protein [Planctomycetaceae bacterium]